MSPPTFEDRLYRLLQKLQSLESNQRCFDCLSRGPTWTSWSLGIFLCFRCAGLHRGLGVHISRVKSVNLDRWTPQQVARLLQIGNRTAAAIYESRLPTNFHRPNDLNELRAFIQIKYLHRVYVTPGFRDPPMPPADLTLEQLEDIMADFHKQIACHAKIPTEPNPFDGLPRCGTTNDLINLSTDCPSDDLSSRSESSDLVSGRSSSESLPSERPHSAKAILLDNSRSSDREADFTDSADLQRVALLGPVDENPFEAEDDEQFSLISF